MSMASWLSMSTMHFMPWSQRPPIFFLPCSLQLWEKRSGKCLATLSDHTGPVYSAVWCTDGSLIATGGEV
jgi:WD40 repeat protein